MESWAEGGYTTADPAGPAGEILVGGRAVAGGYYGFDDGSFFEDQQGRDIVHRSLEFSMNFSFDGNCEKVLVHEGCR